MGLTVGSQIRLSYKVRDASGVLVNPATASLTISLPDRTTVVNVNPTLPPAQTGIIYYDYTTTQPGPHTVAWNTTAPITADTSSFYIDPATYPGIFPLSEAKTYLNEPLTDETNDDDIERFLFAVTEIVESKVGPVIPKTYMERVDSGYVLPLSHGPIISVTSVTPWMPGMAAETVPVSQITIDYEGWCLERNIGFWRGPYKVIYLGGRVNNSYSIILGAKEILNHLWETQRGPSLVGPGAPPANSDESFSIGGRAYTVPRAVLEMLHPEEIGPKIG